MVRTACSGSGTDQPLRVGDLVAAPPVRTVVQMADLRDPELRRRLAQDFVATADAEHAVRTVLADVSAGAGRGYFVEGNYGAGKSHLLAALQLALSGELPSVAVPAARRPVLAVAVSLVEHAAAEPLERIVLAHLSEALAARPSGAPAPQAEPPGALARREVWERRAAEVAHAGYGGLALLVDELSEFLRSKPDGRSLNEDVRFLQFLGEWAERLPAWIACSTQEAIEVAADIPPQVLARIKDRYPVRFRLAGQHVRELVARRLVRHRDGAEPALRQIYEGLRRAFGGLPFSWEDFLGLYPLHPATVDLLDELRPLFSQHRGVVDFIRARLAGDPARRIAGFLDQPADRLLCPDAVWDHFEDRVRELPETSRVAGVAVPYLEREARRLLADPEAAGLALRAVRLLALGAVCPTPRAWSAGELADRLLHRLTDLDPELNLDFLREALDRLASGGTYVVREGDRYRLDAAADAGQVLRRRADHARRGLLPADGRLFRQLAGWCDDALVPLARLSAASRSLQEVRWMGGTRQVSVWCARIGELAGRDVREWVQDLQSGETDVGLLLAQAYPGEAAAARQRWERVLRPALVQAAGSEPVLAWLPREATAQELGELRQALAVALVGAELAGDRSEQGRRLQAHLDEALPEQRRRTAEIYRALYLDGEVVGCGGQSAFPAAIGAPVFAALLERLIDAPLRARFPRHPEVAARTDLATPATLERALDLLASQGEIRSAGDPGLKTAVERVLVPLGLACRTPRGHRLQLDPDGSPLAGELLSAAGAARPADPARLDDLYRRLRRGPYGLPRRSFEVLVLALVRCGALSGCRAGRRLPAAQVTAASLWELEGVAGAEAMPAGAVEQLAALPFLPARLRRGPFAPAALRSIWQAIVAWRHDWAGALGELEGPLAALRAFPGLRTAWGTVGAGELERVRAWVSAVHVSSAPQAGVERFLAAWNAGSAPDLALERAERLRGFLAGRLDAFLFMAGYLASPDLRPAAGLVAERDRLAALACDPPAVLGDEGWQRLSEGFARFRETHAASYAAAHDAAVGRAALRPYEDLRAGSAYGVVERLGSVPGLAVVHDRVDLDRRLDLALAASCGREAGEVETLLQRLPACPCGFRADAPPDREAPDALREACSRSARAYLAALRAPVWAERLLAYAGGLAAAGRRDEAARLGDLLRLDASVPDAVERAADLLAGTAGRTLVAALTGRTAVVRRDLADLDAALAGRAFERRRLLAAVEAWLGSTPPGSYVLVAAASAAQRAAGARRRGGSTSDRTCGAAAGDEPEGGAADGGGAGAEGLAAGDAGLAAGRAAVPEGGGLAAAAVPDAVTAAAGGEPEEGAADGGGAGAEGLAAGCASAGDRRAREDGRDPGDRPAPEDRRDPRDRRDPEDGRAREDGRDPEDSPAPEDGRDPGDGRTPGDARAREDGRDPADSQAPGDGQAAVAERRALARLPEMRSDPEALAALGRETPDRPSVRAARGLLALDALIATAGSPPADGPGWERAYTAYAQGGRHLAEARDAMRMAGLAGLAPVAAWQAEWRQVARAVRSAFRAYHAALPETAPQGVRTLASLYGEWSARGPRPKRAGRAGPGVFWWCLDALRADLLEPLTEELGAASEPLCRGLLWAAAPTVTLIQFEMLRAAGFRGPSIPWGDEEVEAVLADPGSLAEVDWTRGGESVCRWTFLDDRVHACRDDFAAFVAEFRTQARRRLVPAFRALPAGALVLLFGDHGFVERPSFADGDGVTVPRYAHGGVSPEEVLAPWAVLRRSTTPGPNGRASVSGAGPRPPASFGGGR